MENVTDRANTVLEFAITSGQITVEQQQRLQQCAALAKDLGFEYTSFIGVHSPGSKGSTSVSKSKTATD